MKIIFRIMHLLLLMMEIQTILKDKESQRDVSTIVIAKHGISQKRQKIHYSLP